MWTLLAQQELPTQPLAEQAKAAGGQVADQFNRVYDLIVPSLPTVFGALAILVIGWLAALLIAGIVRLALRRTGLDKRLAQSVAGKGAEAPKVENIVSKGVFYLLLVLVLVAFFDTLGLTQVTQSLNGLLNQFLTYVPRVVGAGLLLMIAWLVATVARFVASQLAHAVRLDERLTAQAATEKPVAVSAAIGNTVYWLVYLLFLPAILNALALPGLLVPVQEMVTKVLAFLPNLFAAALIIGIGWFVARAIQRITTNLLAAVGTDNIAQRAGLGTILGERRLSEILGLVVYILILLPVLVASLNALQIEAVTGPASQMLNMVLSAVPALFAAAVVIVIAYIVGRIVAGLVTNLLTGIGFNRLPARLGLSKHYDIPAGQRTPSQIAGTLLLVATMLFAVMQALPILGFDLLAGMISELLFFAGHVVMGLIIFAIGLYLANLAVQVVRASRVAQAGLLSLAARVAIIVLAGAMALRQMGLANEIITSAFTIVLGAVGVALALAFGLGGRDAAARTLHRYVEPNGALRPGEPRDPVADAATFAGTPSRPGAPIEYGPRLGEASMTAERR